MDALVALSQRTVYVALWQGTDDGLRTMVSSAGVTALPIFTDLDELRSAVGRLGWLGADGSVPTREIGARAALSHALAHDLLVVVDLGSKHAMEIDREEIAPLLSPQARRESSGPFAAAGRVSSSLMQAVKTATPPGGLAIAPRTSATNLAAAAAASATVTQPSSQSGGAGGSGGQSQGVFRRPSDSPSQGLTVQATAGPGAPASEASATFGSGSSVRIAELTAAPADALLDAMRTALRDYPEVEWACIAAFARGPASPTPTVGLESTPRSARA